MVTDFLSFFWETDFFFPLRVLTCRGATPIKTGTGSNLALSNLLHFPKKGKNAVFFETGPRCRQSKGNNFTREAQRGP